MISYIPLNVCFLLENWGFFFKLYAEDWILSNKRIIPVYSMAYHSNPENPLGVRFDYSSLSDRLLTRTSRVSRDINKIIMYYILSCFGRLGLRYRAKQRTWDVRSNRKHLRCELSLKKQRNGEGKRGTIEKHTQVNHQGVGIHTRHTHVCISGTRVGNIPVAQHKVQVSTGA